MPAYDYACPACGIFTASRPMSEFREPCVCPECGEAAPRAFVRAPVLAGMDPARRRAMAVNEQSRHEPKRSSGHGAGCGCCSGAKPAGRGATGPAGAKSFPAQRPWMISH